MIARPADLVLVSDLARDLGVRPHLVTYHGRRGRIRLYHLDGRLAVSRAEADDLRARGGLIPRRERAARLAGAVGVLPPLDAFTPPHATPSTPGRR